MFRLQTFLLILACAYFHEALSFVVPGCGGNSIKNVRRCTSSSSIAVSFQTASQTSKNKWRNSSTLFEQKDGGEEERANANAVESLPPSESPPSDEIAALPSSQASTSTSTSEGTNTSVLFINQETKRVLIEELGYRRKEVERLRPELAVPIVSKRLSRPVEGVPEDWMIPEKETSSAMLERLEKESRYPLKFPLLAVSLILFGKGFGDALITIIKVNINFPGTSLTESFMGFPVLAIDALCALVGGALGFWTWKTMKD